MSEYKINAAIQLLPIETKMVRWEIIDKAIKLIRLSGLNYKVCPFETVVEGTTEQVFKLISDIKNLSLENGSEEVLMNIKLHAANRDLFFNEKLEKHI